jgi:hypothetical protein
MRYLSRIMIAMAAIFALTLTTAPPSSAMIKSVDGLASRVQGGSVTSPHLHVIASITGHYKVYRRVNGHQHAFYGVTVSAQHCKASGCWGSIKHGRLPIQYPRGTAVGSTALSMGIPCWVHACVNPVDWAKKAASGVANTSDFIGKADEWFYKQITMPCVFGVGGGWVKTSAEQVSRRFVLLGGWMSKAKYSAGVAGPDGYAVAGVAGCGVTLGAVGVAKSIQVARKLGTQ